LKCVHHPDIKLSYSVYNSYFFRYYNSAAADGVGALKSATKSAIV